MRPRPAVALQEAIDVDADEGSELVDPPNFQTKGGAQQQSRTQQTQQQKQAAPAKQSAAKQTTKPPAQKQNLIEGMKEYVQQTEDGKEEVKKSGPPN